MWGNSILKIKTDEEVLQMEKAWDTVIKVLAAVGGAVAGLFGGWDTLLAVFVGAMAVDYASGVIVALMQKSAKTESGGLSSNVGWKGIGRKGLMIAVVLVASMLDKAMGGTSAVCRNAACWFYIANELLSFVENLAMAGVPFPEKIKNILEQKKRESDEIPEDV